jgi:hypothetical protein
MSWNYAETSISRWTSCRHNGQQAMGPSASPGDRLICVSITRLFGNVCTKSQRSVNHMFKSNVWCFKMTTQVLRVLNCSCSQKPHHEGRCIVGMWYGLHRVFKAVAWSQLSWFMCNKCLQIVYNVSTVSRQHSNDVSKIVTRYWNVPPLFVNCVSTACLQSV